MPADQTNTRGQAGYLFAEVTVSIGGIGGLPYFGGGIAGLYPAEPGIAYYTDFSFFTKMREEDFVRPRIEMSAEAYRWGVSNSVSRRINMAIYYKGTNYPPDFEVFEYVYMAIVLGKWTRRQVVHIESFRQTGDIERALEYTVTGETVGIVATDLNP